MAPATTTMSPGPDAGSVVGTADYVNDAYRIDVTQPNMHIFEGPDVVISDTIIDVDDTKVAGSNNNGFGIWCRNKLIENSVPTSGYRALINSNGYYTMQKSDNGECWYPLVENKDQTISDFIYRGEHTNHIRFKCAQNTLDLTVNGHDIEKVYDSAYASGSPYLQVGTGPNAAYTSVLFDNFVVSSL